MKKVGVAWLLIVLLIVFIAAMSYSSCHPSDGWQKAATQERASLILQFSSPEHRGHILDARHCA